MRAPVTPGKLISPTGAGTAGGGVGAAPSSNRILMESGSYLLLESGSYVLKEN